MMSLRLLLPAAVVAASLVPVPVAAAPPSIDRLVTMLDDGIGEPVVAELAGCPDVAALESFILGPEEFVGLRSSIGALEVSHPHSVETPLLVERRGLAAASAFSFRFGAIRVPPAARFGAMPGMSLIDDAVGSRHGLGFWSSPLAR